jgi:DUF218 domain-containing protein
VKRPAFFRRSEIWLPTLWGWLVLLVLGVAVAFLAARNLHGFLATTKPVGARILVVEGWMGSEELEETAAIFRSRGYERVITTGGPIIRWPPSPGPETFADQAAWYLQELGLPENALTAVPAKSTSSDRTYLSAVTVREWAKRSGLRLEAFDVISNGPHARRSWLLYRRVFGPEVKVGILATKSYDYDAARWWRSSIGAQKVIDQAVGVLWVQCCFRAAD